MMPRAFGRLPHDTEAFAAAPTLARHLYATAEPAQRLDRRDVPFQPQLRHNDALPICTVAALINGLNAIETLNTGAGLAIADDVELAFYASVAKCAPTVDAIAATDGLNMLDVLRAQGTRGFDIGGVAPMAGDFGTVPCQRSQLAPAMGRLGFGYWGIDLYERDMDTPPSIAWDDDGRDAGKLVGGHLVMGWDYLGLGDTDTGRVATWGYFQPFTWRWVEKRLRGAAALFFPSLQLANAEFWCGLNAAEMRADNAAWLAA